MPIKRGTVIVKPSKTAVENFRQNLKTTYNRLSKSLVITLIKELNPKIRGWANYFNAGGGWTHIKNKLGHWIFHKNLKWVYKKHSRVKGQKRLLLQRYFKGVHRRPGYYNKWTLFGKDKGNNVAYITDIQEITVAHDSGMAFNPSPNPYKPEDYPKFDKKRKRQIKKDVRLNKLKHKLLVLQDGNCIKCGQLLDLNTEQVELDHIIPKVDGGENSMRNMALLHKECHLQKTNWERKWRSYERKRKLKEKDKEPVAKKHRASYACQQWQKKIETKSVE